MIRLQVEIFRRPPPRLSKVILITVVGVLNQRRRTLEPVPADSSSVFDALLSSSGSSGWWSWCASWIQMNGYSWGAMAYENDHGTTNGNEEAPVTAASTSMVFLLLHDDRYFAFVW